MIYHQDDQPDSRNAPPAADIREIILFRDMNQAAATSIVGMLDGVRSNDPNWCGASVRMRIAHARNMLEASLANLDTVEAECLFHLAEREQVHLFTKPLPAKPFGRRRIPDAALPATVSPARA